METEIFKKKKLENLKIWTKIENIYKIHSTKRCRIDFNFKILNL